MGKNIIALNGTIISPQRSDGFGRVTYEIIKMVKSKYSDALVYTNKQNAPLFKLNNGVDIINTKIKYSESNFTGHVSRFLWHQTVLPISLINNNINLYFSPIPDGMLFPPCKQIITIYDLLPILYPQSSPRIKYYYKYILPKIINSSSALITGSESTKADVLSYYKDIPCPIYVVYPGYKNDMFFRRSQQEINNVNDKYKLDKYIITVGEIRPYKNIRRLVSAFTNINNNQHDLVIVGKKSRLEKDIEQMPIDLHVKKRIKYLGYVSDVELASLYSGAQMMVHPSLYEGFGLPPLEAMACGCPVIVSNSSSIPEVCGDAGCYFDPYDVDNIIDAINEVLGNKSLQKDLALKGVERAKYFSYDKMVAQLVNIFNRLS
jgi:glycosyltransferase involved in cell wall biosynthesis